jgi:hypothetical protein
MWAIIIHSYLWFALNKVCAASIDDEFFSPMATYQQKNLDNVGKDWIVVQLIMHCCFE